MPTYVHGWRRKLGVVTLGMAVVLMGGWVRSISICDAFVVPWSGSTVVLFSSGEGDLALLPVESDEFALLKWQWLIPITDETVIQTDTGWDGPFGTYLDEIHDPAWRSYWVSYWSIIIPLTLLSAYLLLSKPRTPHQKKINDPIHVEGA